MSCSHIKNLIKLNIIYILLFFSIFLISTAIGKRLQCNIQYLHDIYIEVYWNLVLSQSLLIFFVTTLSAMYKENIELVIPIHIFNHSLNFSCHVRISDITTYTPQDLFFKFYLMSVMLIFDGIGSSQINILRKIKPS